MILYPLKLQIYFPKSCAGWSHLPSFFLLKHTNIFLPPQAQQWNKAAVPAPRHPQGNSFRIQGTNLFLYVLKHSTQEQENPGGKMKLFTFTLQPNYSLCFLNPCEPNHKILLNSFPCLTVIHGKVHYNSILAPSTCRNQPAQLLQTTLITPDITLIVSSFYADEVPRG